MLSKTSIGADPLLTLRRWVADAGLGSQPRGVLATVDSDGDPDARVVIVRRIDEDGLSFCTDDRSPKARQIAVQPRGAIVIHWPATGRQVRIRGAVELLPAAECDAAFAALPRASQLGFWADPQSAVVADRKTMVRRARETAATVLGDEIRRPPYWVVQRLRPETIEFWQSDDDNLHDRIACTRSGSTWRLERLQP